MPPLCARIALAAALLAPAAAAQDTKDSFKGIMTDAHSLQRDRSSAGSSSETCGRDGCKCLPGKFGMRKLRVAVYAPINTEFEGDRFTDAVVAYGKAGVLLRKTNSGTIGLLSSPTRVQTGKDREMDKCFPQAVQRVHDIEDLCAVVKDAFAQEPPKEGSLPVLYEYFTDAAYFENMRESYKEKCPDNKKDYDQIPRTGFVENMMSSGGGSHAIGIEFPHGLASRCAASNVEGVSARPLVLINLEPSQVLKQVTAHEIGHAIGFLSGKSPAIFADIDDKSVDNIMVTKRPIERDQMKLNDLQVQLLCDSPLLADQL